MNLKELKRKAQLLALQRDEIIKDLEAVERVIAIYAEQEGKEDSKPTVEIKPFVHLATGMVSAAVLNATDAGPARFNLAGAIRSAISSLPDTFTKNDVIDAIRKQNPDANGKVKDPQVSAELWRMANRKHVLDVAETGVGNAPNLYKKKAVA